MDALESAQKKNSAKREKSTTRTKYNRAIRAVTPAAFSSRITTASLPAS